MHLFETVFSIAMLGAFIGVVRVLLPRAWQERDPVAITSAALTAVLFMLAWLLMGVGVKAW
jgi:hypothetical protein